MAEEPDMKHEITSKSLYDREESQRGGPKLVWGWPNIPGGGNISPDPRGWRSFLDHEFRWQHYRQREQSLREPRGERSGLFQKPEAGQCDWISESEKDLGHGHITQGLVGPVEEFGFYPKILESHRRPLSRRSEFFKDQSSWGKWIREQERKWGGQGQRLGGGILVEAGDRQWWYEEVGWLWHFGAGVARTCWLLKCEVIRKGIEGGS